MTMTKSDEKFFHCSVDLITRSLLLISNQTFPFFKQTPMLHCCQAQISFNDILFLFYLSQQQETTFTTRTAK